LFDSQKVSAQKIINEVFVFEYQSIEKVIKELK
jgi:NAD dependent epimerase/dehydratase family enzyme